MSIHLRCFAVVENTQAVIKVDAGKGVEQRQALGMLVAKSLCVFALFILNTTNCHGKENAERFPRASQLSQLEKNALTQEVDESPGILGALFETAETVAEQAASLTNKVDGNSSSTELIEALSDTARSGLSVADDMLPPLNPQQSKDFGDSFRKTLLASNSRITDRPTLAFIMPIWREVVTASGIPLRNLTFTLIEIPEVNAFAFVGNNVVLNRGLIRFAQKCDHPKEVIRFVLSHELGHVVHHHTDVLFRRMVAAESFVPGAGIAPSIIQAIVKQTPINQSAEREADCYARKLHVQEGWTLEGGREFFKYAGAMEHRPKSGRAVVSLFASHPDNERRIELLDSGSDCK